MTMRLLKLLLTVGCVVAVLWAAANADWESRVAPSHDDAVMLLGRHPLWEPPETPEVFRVYTRSHRIESRPIFPGDVVTVRFSPVHVAIEASVSAWPALAIVSVLYLAVRGRRRDFALHCAGAVAVCQVVAVVACVVVWPWWVSLDGGWPDLPYDLLALGFSFGLTVGLLTYTPEPYRRGRCGRHAQSSSDDSTPRQRIPDGWPGVG